ncbi:MAG: hypothetical protein HY917_02895 [Candidatus Diapherotrites archaeon]|nr:hypothetical protein [Candidatus Diapherotrites archaeon]
MKWAGIGLIGILLILSGCTQPEGESTGQAVSMPKLDLSSNPFLTRFISEPNRAEMVIQSITVPINSLPKGRYSFPMARFNKGPKKCCETKTETVIYKDYRNLGGSGLIETEACTFVSTADGWIPGETRTNLGTTFYDYNEAGTYQIKAKIKCDVPDTRTRIYSEYAVEVHIQ